MQVKVRKKPVRKAERANYETIRCYIATHYEEYRKTHPLETEHGSAGPHALIEAEKKRYANFLWEFMNFVVCQD